MAQEGNILIDPFRTAFPKAGNATELLLAHPHFSQPLWVWIDSDKISLRYGAATRKTMIIHLVEREGCPTLHIVSTGLAGMATDVYAHDWLHLAEQMDQPDLITPTDLQVTFLIFMRQIGGDVGYAGAYTLKGDFND
jgi:hypothetical protein